MKKLINKCHKRDIHVIMDGVFNHADKDFYLNKYNCLFTGKFLGEFSGLQDLNFHNECTQNFIRDVCLYWIEIFGINGIRFDNTPNFFNMGEQKGLPTLVNDIKKYLNNKNEMNFTITIEHLEENAIKVMKKLGIDSYWDNKLYGKTFQYLWHHKIDNELINALNNKRFIKNPNCFPTMFSTLYLQ